MSLRNLIKKTLQRTVMRSLMLGFSQYVCSIVVMHRCQRKIKKPPRYEMHSYPFAILIQAFHFVCRLRPHDGRTRSYV